MSRGSNEKRRTREITISNAVSSLFFFPSAPLALQHGAFVPFKPRECLQYMLRALQLLHECKLRAVWRIYTQNTRVKLYTHNYTKCKILLSVSANLRVSSRVFFFTCVFRECISRVICVQNGRFTRKKHTCNAAMPVASTVAVKSLSETLTKTGSGHKGKQN